MGRYNSFVHFYLILATVHSSLPLSILLFSFCQVDLVLYSGGRDANSEGLGLEAVGVSTKKYGRIAVDKTYKTTSPKSIYAVGDVTGPPGLASSAQQQVGEM
jgi:pyruvate/2-oxoglutarate dehydrogenase complex dihydrolipoamide dehydrogenase (E3) component